jgi:hypothetical protein
MGCVGWQRRCKNIAKYRAESSTNIPIYFSGIKIGQNIYLKKLQMIVYCALSGHDILKSKPRSV